MKLPHISGLVFATLFGFSFMFSKVALQYISPIGLIAYRFLIAFIAFELLRATKTIQIRLDRGHFKSVFYVVLFQPVLYFIFETTGLSLTTSSEAGMMIALIPIVVSILSVLFLKEYPNLLQIGSIILSISGVLFINVLKATAELNFSLKGLMLLFGAVVSGASYTILSRKASKTIRPYELTYYMMLIGAVVFNFIYIIELWFAGDVYTYVSNLSIIGLWIPIIYLGLAASIGGFLFMNYSLQHLKAHVVSIYANVATVVSIAAGAIILNEPLKYYHYIGSIMIILGVYGTVRFASKEKEAVL